MKYIIAPKKSKAIAMGTQVYKLLNLGVEVVFLSTNEVESFQKCLFVEASHFPSVSAKERLYVGVMIFNARKEQCPLVCGYYLVEPPHMSTGYPVLEYQSPFGVS